jgi:response regulator RpfG family c-di-GMP phosphodiesterase
MSEKILLVDDDIRVVSALQRSLYRSYQVEIAGGAEDALAVLAESAFAVVVADYKMPGTPGSDLLARVKEIAPETVRILLTGCADLGAAIAAVNEGNVFRFLTKPCSQSLLTKALDDALAQHRLYDSEREVLQETLTGAVAVLVEILSAAHPAAFGRASRIRRYVRQLGLLLNPDNLWQFEAAAMLSQIGYISIPPEILKKQQEDHPLSTEEQRYFVSLPAVGRRLIAMIPRMEPVAQMIGLQRDEYCGETDLAPEEYAVALGGQILRTALDFDQLALGGLDPRTALAELGVRGNYDPAVLAAFDSAAIPHMGEEEPVHEKGLQEGPEDLELFRSITDKVRRALRN